MTRDFAPLDGPRTETAPSRPSCGTWTRRATGPSPGRDTSCLQGNLCWALVELGCDDPRLERAFEWMARSVTGEGVAPITDKKALVRYYAGKCGPGFACGANDKLPCAWGAVKALYR